MLRDLNAVGRQETGRWLNNRVESSYLPFRRRKQVMQRFRRMKSLHKFCAVHATVHNHFNRDRHLIRRGHFSPRRSAAQVEWKAFAT